MNKTYQELKDKMQRIADVEYSAALLNWDQEIFMPENSASFRSRQLSTLSGIAHEFFTDQKMGDLLKTLSETTSLGFKEQRNVAEIKKDYERKKKYSRDFVEKMSQTISQSFSSWQKARKEDDFSIFAPKLSELVDLKKQEADLVGYEGQAYDALLEDYEPGATVKDLDQLFSDVRSELVGFVEHIFNTPQNNDAFMYQHFDKNKQWDFGIYILKAMGYDMQSGRQDLSTHPFTTSFSAQDVRVTTRVDEKNLSEMLWSCIHEGGHALYEQGLPSEEYGMPAGEAISLGVHESQSRIWENNIGRGLPFWKAFYKSIQAYFPDQLMQVNVEDFYKAMNLVKPSLIRTNADELTYHFHILVRYEVEKALISGDIKIKELPEFWNSKYKEYLKVDVPSDAQGVLQDIHWSHGGFGYFPTYSLGSFYAAQYYAQMKKDLPNLEQELENGNCKIALDWLRSNIHQYGRQYSADALCEKVTGEKLNFRYFMQYATKKYSDLYRLQQKDTMIG
ncbi:MAG: carboxypeptidase M32 [Chitinophagales bacterium]